MKARWSRARPALALDAATAARLLAPVVPDAKVDRVTPLSGGLANSNLRVDLADRDAPLLLRLYQRDSKAAGLERALSRKLLPRVEVPAFLHLAEDNPVTGQAYAVLGWIEGTHPEPLLETLPDDRAAALGRAVGRTLAAIHAVGFARHGFLDAGLQVVEPVELGRAGLLAYLRTCLTEGPGAERLGAELTAALFRFAETEGVALDRWLAPVCLVHADFNSTNLLVRPAAEGDWKVAVLDWEFAFAGTPAIEFGNLFRSPGLRRPAFAEGVTAGYLAAGGQLPEGWRGIARIADLFNWAGFLARPHANDALIEDAHTAVRETIAELGG